MRPYSRESSRRWNERRSRRKPSWIRSARGVTARRDPTHDVRGETYPELLGPLPGRREKLRPAPRMGLSPHRLSKRAAQRERLGRARVRVPGRDRMWRFHMSGQFVHFFSLAGEWRDHSTAWPPEPGWRPGRYLYYIQTIYSFVEIFEFAAGSSCARRRDRNASRHRSRRTRGPPDRPAGRQVPLQPNLRDPDAALESPLGGAQTELIARPRELAAEAAGTCSLGSVWM